MAKAIRIFRTILLTFIALIALLWVMLQTPSFQNWLAHTAANRLSKQLGTTVQVKSAYIGWLNRVTLQGVYVADQQNDTLASIGKLQLNTTDWLIFKDSIELKYLKLQDVLIRLQRTDSVWNHRFLADAFAGKSTTTPQTDTAAKDNASPIVLRLQIVEIDNLRFEQLDKWRGKTLIGGVGHLALKADKFDVANMDFNIAQLDLVKPEYREIKKSGLWSQADSARYWRRIDSLDALRTYPESWNPNGMRLRIGTVRVQEGLVEIFNRHGPVYVPGLFDERDIIVTPIHGQLTNVLLHADTLTAKVSLKATERSGLEVKQLHTNLRLHPQLMEFSNMDLHLNNSRLGPYYAMRYTSIDAMEDFVDSVQVKAIMRNSTVHMDDVAFFATELRGIGQTGILSGEASGTISNFVVSNVDLQTGRSHITGTYSMKGLTDIDNTVIRFDTKSTSIDLKDVEPWAPQLKELRNTPLYNAGLIRYNGFFEGTIDNFTTRGFISTDAGSMDAALALRMSGPRQGFEGDIKKAVLNGGKLLGVPSLGMMRFNGKVSSTGFSSKTPLRMKGDISAIDYKGYTYNDIIADAVFTNDILSANLSSADPNLSANFTTVLDFSKKKQNYNARGAVAYANLHALHLSKDSVVVSGLFDVNFSGTNIDDFRGYARIYDAEVYNKRQLLNIDSLYLESSIDENNTETLVLQTNEADIRISGDFDMSDLPNGFQAFLHNYYPSVIDAPKKLPRNQLLTFSVETRNVEPFLDFIDPKLKGLNYTSLIGSLDTRKSELLVNLDMPYFEYGGIVLNNTAIRANGSNHALMMTGNIENFRVNDSLGFPNAQILINTVNDTTQVQLTTRTNGPLGDAAINGFFYSKPDGFEARFDESSFILNNKKWTVISDGSIEMRKGYLISNGLQLVNDNQRIKLYTQPSDDGYWNDVYVDVDDFIIGDVLPFVVAEPRMEGLLSTRTVIQDPMGKPYITSTFATKNFFFNNDSIGTVSGTAQYDHAKKLLKTTVDSRNADHDFTGLLSLNLDDSAAEQIDLNVTLRKERINPLRKYLDGILADVDGYATGNLSLKGKMNAPALLGEVMLNDGKLTVEYTQCTYWLEPSKLVFGDNFIDFGSVQLKDAKGRKGTMEGLMYHRFFDSLSFNMKMRSNGLQLLNTVSKDNDLFYGQAVGKASFDLYGPLNNLNMRITGATTDTSHIIIANKAGKESGTADFIVFKQYGRELEAEIDSAETNIHIELDLTATPLCQIDVIMDETTGDIIKANGTGNLKIKTGTSDETEMRGRYQIESGSYNFSFQTLFKKPFILDGGENSYIEWNGNPYEANLNIGARYKAVGVSLRDLMASEQGQTVLDQTAQNYKGDVYVKARLTGLLSKPDIAFGIEFPQGSAMQNNLSAQQMIRQIEADKSEMLRQVTYLIVFKSFAPYKEGVGARNPGTDLAVNTISDLLSNQMGKILTSIIQEITGDQSLNIDFSTEVYNSNSLVGGSVSSASGYDRVNFNFMLNKSYFNNRVVVNLGSDFDLNVRNTTTTGFQFLPDVSVEFILTNNRRLRAILFKKDALDFAGRRNRAGVSLSYRKEFDKLFSSKQEEALIFLKKEDDDTKQ